jgi:hypothetical protein
LPYEIKPQRRFMPDDGHTDSAGNTPEEKTYWSDTRDGSVTVTNSPKK